MSEIPQLSEKLKKAISDAGKPTTAAKPLGRLDIDPYRHHRQFLYLIKVKGSLGIKYTKILKLVENMRLLQTLKMPNKVELNYYLEDVVKILNHSEKENSVTLVFSDKLRNSKKTLYFIHKNDIEDFVENIQRIKSLDPARHTKDNLLVLRQHTASSRKSRDLRKYTWFYSDRKSRASVQKMNYKMRYRVIEFKNGIDIKRYLTISFKDSMLYIHNDDVSTFPIPPSEAKTSTPLSPSYYSFELMVPQETEIDTIPIAHISQIQDYLEDHRGVRFYHEDIMEQYIFKNVNQLFQFKAVLSAFLKRDLYKLTTGSQKEIQEQLNTFAKLHESDTITKSEHLRVYITTFNIGTAQLEDINLNDWLGNQESHDLIVIGVQECKMHSKKQFVRNLQYHLYDLGHEMLASVFMWEMFLVVFCKRHLMNRVNSVQTAWKGLGAGGVLGNKGGLIISFAIGLTRFNFLNCHLIHGPNNWQQRNEMLIEFLRQARISRKEMDPDFQADHSFILGDLNYRSNTTFSESIDSVLMGYTYFKPLDQLHLTMSAKQLYVGYKQPLIGFIPSYRRLRDQAGGFSNKKEQAPSYTDRIIYKSSSNHSLVNIEYSSKENLMGSDHKPVYGMFDAEVKFEGDVLDIFNPMAFVSSTVRFLTLELNYERFDIVGKSVGFPMHLQVSFYSPIIEEFVSTSENTVAVQEQQDQLQVWKASEIPPIFTARPSLQFLKDYKVFILVWMTSPNVKQMVIGQGVFYFNSFKSPSEVIKFKTDLTLQTRLVGSLSGEVKLEPPSSSSSSSSSSTH